MRVFPVLHLHSPPTCLIVVPSLYFQLWKIFSVRLQVIVVDSCFVTICAFDVSIGGDELKYFLFCHLGHT